MRQSLLHGCFNGLTAPFYFAHQHSALHRGDAEIGQDLGVGLFGKIALRFLSDEERSKFVLDDLKDKAEVLADKFIIICHFVSQGSEGAAAGHFIALLQFDLGTEPHLQILPRIDFIADARCASLYLIQMRLKYFVDEAFFALEIVIELPLSCSRSFDDFIGAGSASSLLVKQICRAVNNSQSGFCASHELSSHNLSVPGGTTAIRDVHAPRWSPLRSLYLISVFSITINSVFFGGLPSAGGEVPGSCNSTAGRRIVPHGTA